MKKKKNTIKSVVQIGSVELINFSIFFIPKGNMEREGVITFFFFACAVLVICLFFVSILLWTSSIKTTLSFANIFPAEQFFSEAVNSLENVMRPAPNDRPHVRHTHDTDSSCDSWRTQHKPYT